MSPLGKPSLDASEVKAVLKRLNLRIALVAVIVMAELWALTAALEAWADGHMERLPWLLAFQVVAFGGAIGSWVVTPRQPITAD
jgi:hypothetical protein